MKALKIILASIMGLIAIMCGLILLCVVNPELSDSMGRRIYGKTREEAFVTEDAEESMDNKQGDEALPELSLPEEPESLPEETSQEAEEETSGISGSGIQPEEPVWNEVQEPKRGAKGYEIPEEGEVKAPKELSGKSGYQPITEKSVELPGAEGGEYTSELGYGETGDELSFDRVMYPYYAMLDEKGKHLYRQIYANAMACNPAFVPIEAIPVDAVKNTVEAVYNDHPELFWLNTAFTCKYDQNKICAELTLEFNDLAENLADNSRTLGNEANRILTQVENLGSDQEKERALHDLLLEELEYDSSADRNQSVYSALAEKKSVCAGYARAMQYLMQRLGIPCYYCTGYTGQDHAWNIVKLGDAYYNVDVTWDDTPGGEYDYYNKTDQEFAPTHVRRSLSVDLPKCGS